MTGRRGPNIDTPPDPDPIAQPIPGRAEEEAKKKVRKRAGGGRFSTIFAGQLNRARGNTNTILNTSLGGQG